MEGSKFLQVLTILLCLGLAYFVYDTNKEVKALHKENATLWAKIDSIQNVPAAKTAAKKKSASARAASLLDEIVSDAERSYKEAKKAEAKSIHMSVSSTYRLEDRYVSYGVEDPDYLGNTEGKVVVDIVVNQLGGVNKARLNAASTISDEEVVEACKKAALKTNFNYNHDAQDNQPGVITYTFTRR